MTSILKNLTILNGSLARLRCCDATIFARVNLATTDAGICTFTNGDLAGGVGIDLTVLNADMCRLTYKNTILMSFVDLTTSECRICRATLNADASTRLTRQETTL